MNRIQKSYEALYTILENITRHEKCYTILEIFYGIGKCCMLLGKTFKNIIRSLCYVILMDNIVNYDSLEFCNFVRILHLLKDEKIALTIEITEFSGFLITLDIIVNSVVGL